MSLRGSENAGFEPDDVSKTHRKKTPENAGGEFVSEKAGDKVVLQRELGLLSCLGIIVGTMIGSGIFVSPGNVLRGTGSVGLSIIVWAGCGLISCAGALCYIELGCLIQASGGETVYIKAGLGDFLSFIFSWMRSLVIQPSSNAIISLAFAEYSLAMVPGVSDLDEDYNFLLKRLLAVFTLMLVAGINIFSVKLAAMLQNVFTVAKLSALALIIGGGVYNLCQGQVGSLTYGFQHQEGMNKLTAASVALAFYSGLWSFDGWNQLNYCTEELKDPTKNLPRAIIIGIPLVSVLYILVNISYLTVLEPLEIAQSQTVGVEWSMLMLGPVSWIMPIAVALSTFGALNGCVFTAARQCLAASRIGFLPSLLSFVSVDFLTPFPALVFNTLLASTMLFIGDIGKLIDFFSFTAWIFYGQSMLSLLVMRYTKKDAKRPFKVWIWIPILVFLISCYFTIAPVLEDPAIEYLYVLGFMLVGALVYPIFIKRRLQCCSSGPGCVTLGIQKLLKVAPETESEHLE